MQYCSTTVIKITVILKYKGFDSNLETFISETPSNDFSLNGLWEIPRTPATKNKTPYGCCTSLILKNFCSNFLCPFTINGLFCYCISVLAKKFVFCVKTRCAICYVQWHTWYSSSSTLLLLICVGEQHQWLEIRLILLPLHICSRT